MFPVYCSTPAAPAAVLSVEMMCPSLRYRSQKHLSPPSREVKAESTGAADEDEAEKQQPKAATTGVSDTSPSDENDIPAGAVDNERLIKLSNLQARIVNTP